MEVGGALKRSGAAKNGGSQEKSQKGFESGIGGVCQKKQASAFFYRKLF